jgi:hypothetical protein
MVLVVLRAQILNPTRTQVFLILDWLLEMDWASGSAHLMTQFFFFYKLDRACSGFNSLGWLIRVSQLIYPKFA